MPLRTWDTKADFDAAYSMGAEGLDGHDPNRPEVKLHYHRSIIGGTIATRAKHFAEFFGLKKFNKRILIVGGGFGWLAEEMRKLGFTMLLTTDISTYIQAEKDNDDEIEIRAEIAAVGLNPNQGRGAVLLNHHKTVGKRRRMEEILDADICTPAGRFAVMNIFGNPRIVITESVLESLTDTEAITLAECAHLFAPPQDVYHLVHTPSRSDNPGYNFQSLTAWKALIPMDTFIDAATFEVL